ncbi:lengsin-like [Gigantopelta aegis]|uniref:lengsin-like n=1 Tax=Gigantopelta aegis TaxID=1735272 RepID=UPI001B88AAB0|nr:lengsin-like [Gigantopelta aegis]
MDKLERTRQELSKYQYVQFTFCDINGTSRGKILPVRNADSFEKGLAIYAGSLMFGHKSELVIPKEVSDAGFGNMVFVPDLDTLHPIPWAGNGKFKVAEFYCETAWMPSRKYQDACPRYIAKRQSQRLQDMGYDSFSGFEIEFILKNQQTKASLFYGPHYCMNKTFGRLEPFLLELDTQLSESGVEIGELHVEYPPGMVECVMKPQWGIKCPDSTFGFVQGVFEMAEQHDLLATFVSKSKMTQCGIGSHFNIALWNKETRVNVFHDATQADCLSETTRYWIGGLMKHAGALTAICSPTVNCYRRLFQPWAPGKCFWDIDNRNATFRVKNDNMKNTYIENRIPSGKCNPYLVYAATLAAGIDGIVNKIKCPPPNDPSAPDLPSSLAAALDALKQDDAMMSALSQQFVDWFIQLKTEKEIKPLQEAPNDEKRFQMEIEMYG